MGKQLKYDRAYDFVEKAWVKPQDVLHGNLHDPLRYFSRVISDMEYKSGCLTDCVVLTTNSGCEYTNKNGKTVKKQRFFTKIADYTPEFKAETDKKLREATIKYHKLAIDAFALLAKLDASISIDALYCSIGGHKIPVLKANKYKIDAIRAIEESLPNSNRIPDILATITFTNSLGNKVVKEVAFEMCFTHEVDYKKRIEYQQKGISCVEINIWDVLKSNQLNYKNELIELVASNGVWISSPLIDKFKHSVIEISGRTVLQKSKDFDVNDSIGRYYFFKDDLQFRGASESCPCMESHKKSVNYSECKNCSNCVYFHDSDEIADVLILCDRKNRQLGKNGVANKCLDDFLED